MDKIRILLAEDDENLGHLLKEYLQIKGYETVLYTDGDHAYKGFVSDHFDLCLLDIMMPVKDGFTLAREIRELNSDIPIVFLTAKSMKEDVIEGFLTGADDYITKPFDMEVLLKRIEAILRRTKAADREEDKELHIGKYIFDTNKQELRLENKVQKLTTKESELLRLLYNHRNGILERNFALRTIWMDDNYFNARSMDVYITKLRKYLRDDPSVEIINIHGKGYRLVC